MSKFSTLLFFVISLLYWKSNGVNACSCFPSHPQEKICNADFAFVGKVLSEELIPGQQPDPNNNFSKWKYTLRLIYSIKGNLGNIGSDVEFETAGNGALCGIRLKVGDKYLLSGHERDGVKRVLLCDLILKSDTITFEQMVYFFTTCSYSYVRNCKPKPNENNRPGIDCKLPTDPKIRFCYFQTALCRYRYGKSTWINADC